MVDTSINGSGDVVAFLEDQHEQIKRLFAETLSASGPRREEAFIALRRLLAVHETAEEEIVHPRARREVADGDQLVDARLSEEHQAKELLSQLEDLDVHTETFTQRLSELRDAVIQHAEREEREEFPRLREELTGKEGERMQRAAQLAESFAPTRAHPGVESPLANLVVGPFAAMTDRARDAILGYRKESK